MMAIKRNEQEKSFQFVQGTRILGRKRVLNPQNAVDSSAFFSPVCFTQKRRTRRTQLERINLLEYLPRDMLVKVLCKVDHSDLKHLILVSKTVSEGALIARETHHLYSTPVKSIIKGPKNSENYDNTPSAPKQNRVARSRIEGKDLASVAVVLFSNDED
ncbi:hypothetical protein LUZ60_010609 [Juncus effusus]|nr:hypothetical protein LUZ60_010609 [Juncus effusus]